MTLAIRHVLAPGNAQGICLRLSEPLSFWGGFNSATGTVIDRAHRDHGRRLSKSILAMPLARGSSSSSSVLAEAIRLGTAPAGIILGARDPILPIGAIVAMRLYGTACPIVFIDDFDALIDGMWTEIDTATVGVTQR